ncbi:MAG: large subunit ribosomal protein L17 [Verrucomicrobiales bacterium]|jgi:large subunit ribosomal protein L17
MRHRRKTVKLQRKSAHRDAMLTNQACSLIEHKQIKTTLAKAKALRPIAERLVTLGKRALAAEETKDAIHFRRVAFAKLGSSTLAQRSVKTLFDDIAPAAADRQGGYTRITKLGQRFSDSAPMAFIEWVDTPSAKVDEV